MGNCNTIEVEFTINSELEAFNYFIKHNHFYGFNATIKDVSTEELEKQLITDCKIFYWDDNYKIYTTWWKDLYKYNGRNYRIRPSDKISFMSRLYKEYDKYNDSDFEDKDKTKRVYENAECFFKRELWEDLVLKEYNRRKSIIDKLNQKYSPPSYDIATAPYLDIAKEGKEDIIA